MRKLLLLLWLLLPVLAPAQPDTLQVFTRRALLQLVTDNHPSVKQAMLRNDMGVSAVRAARGAFDPRVVAAYTEKDFDDQEYYSLLDAGLKVPTWFGVEVFGGFQSNEGLYVNDEDITPEDGLLKAGVSVPVGQGLFIDKRRADLRKAEAYQDMAEAERLRLLNDVFYEALTDHLDWIAAYQRLGVARSAVAQAEVRLNGIRGSYRGGDRPAIDTLEALLQLQDRLMRSQEAEVDYRNASLVLSNHLWDEYRRPLEIGPSLLPDTLDLLPPAEEPRMDSILVQALEQHPKLLELSGKLQQLDVERRLRGEYLKPQLDLNYTLLADGALIGSGAEGSRNPNDRQWGVAFSMPVLLRKERGDLSLARLRQTEAELDIERERQRIRTTIGRRSNELDLLARQVDLGGSMVANYSGLLNGENRRFQAGESSLFLVNQREVALLESRLKQVELQAKFRKSYYILDKDAGILWSQVSTLLSSTP